MGRGGVSQDCDGVASHVSMLVTRKHMRAPREHELEGDARCTTGSVGGDHAFCRMEGVRC